MTTVTEPDAIGSTCQGSEDPCLMPTVYCICAACSLCPHAYAVFVFSTQLGLGVNKGMRGASMEVVRPCLVSIWKKLHANFCMCLAKKISCVWQIFTCKQSLHWANRPWVPPMALSPAPNVSTVTTKHIQFFHRIFSTSSTKQGLS